MADKKDLNKSFFAHQINNEKYIIEIDGPGWPDGMCVDLDGNDYEIWKKILDCYSPTVAIAEYNGRFGPNTPWVMKYNDKHNWKGDLYFGASFFSGSFCVICFLGSSF